MTLLAASLAGMSEIDLSPNVYGVETEYSALIVMPGGETQELVGSCHSVDVRLNLYNEPEKESSFIDNDQLDKVLSEMGIYRNGVGMLSNGGRLYEDPSGYEYATPETSTAAEAVHRMYDGDEIMFRTLRSLQERDIVESFQLNRRNVDHDRTSRGIHINTATNIDEEYNVHFAVQALSALHVAKGALFGSGGLLINEKGRTQFHHSPRLSLTDQVSGDVSQWDRRSLVRLPFKQDIGCRRIESVSTDALNFAWPMRASMVITNALVKLLEIKEYNEDLPLLRDPVRAARVVGRLGHNCTVSVLGADGFVGYRPTEILQEIASIVLDADAEYEFLDDESDQVLGEIIDTADHIERDPTEVMKQVESVARYEFMKDRMNTGRLSWDSEKMCRFDYYWDKIGGGIAQNLREKKGWGWLGFDKAYNHRETMRRIVLPPADTRALLRGSLIGDSLGGNDSIWSLIDLDESIYAVPPLENSTQSLDPVK